jgi:hypothetical protein
MKRFGVLLASAVLGAALVVSSLAAAFRGGVSFGGGHMMGGGGHMMGGMGGHPMMSMGGGFAGRSMAMGGFNRSFAGFNRGMFTGRSVFVPGGNRFVGTPFARRHAFVDRRFFDEGRRDRFEDRFEHHFRHRRFFVNSFDDFAFFGVPFAYDYAAYGNGAGAGMDGSGLTSAMATIMATSNYS